MADAVLTTFVDENPPVSNRHGNVVVNLGGVDVVLTRHVALRFGRALFDFASQPDGSAADILPFQAAK